MTVKCTTKGNNFSKALWHLLSILPVRKEVVKQGMKIVKLDLRAISLIQLTQTKGHSSFIIHTIMNVIQTFYEDKMSLAQRRLGGFSLISIREIDRKTHNWGSLVFR